MEHKHDTVIAAAEHALGVDHGGIVFSYCTDTYGPMLFFICEMLLI